MLNHAILNSARRVDSIVKGITGVESVYDSPIRYPDFFLYLNFLILYLNIYLFLDEENHHFDF